MNLFQWFALSVLVLLLTRDFYCGLARGAAGRMALFRAAVWLLAAAAVADPVVVQWLANAIGIGRGADVLLYLFVLIFIATSFYFYSRQMRMRREITEMVRHMALTEVRRGGLAQGGNLNSSGPSSS